MKEGRKTVNDVNDRWWGKSRNLKAIVGNFVASARSLINRDQYSLASFRSLSLLGSVEVLCIISCINPVYSPCLPFSHAVTHLVSRSRLDMALLNGPTLTNEASPSRRAVVFGSGPKTTSDETDDTLDDDLSEDGDVAGESTEDGLLWEAQVS